MLKKVNHPIHKSPTDKRKLPYEAEPAMLFPYFVTDTKEPQAANAARGSGFFIRNNSHVISDKNRITIPSGNGRKRAI